MQADRIRPVRGSGVEHTLFGSTQIIAWMNRQNAPISLMQPAEDDDLIADRNAVQASLDVRFQDQVSLRGAFITLPRRVGYRGKWALDMSYRVDGEVGHGSVGHRKIIARPQLAAESRAGTVLARRVVA